MTGAFLIAATVGWGVYRSCTKFAHMRRAALIVDAIGTTALIWWCHYLGLLT